MTIMTGTTLIQPEVTLNDQSKGNPWTGFRIWWQAAMFTSKERDSSQINIKREYPRIAIQLLLQEMSCSLSNFYTRILKRTLMSFLGKYAPLEGLCSGIVKSFPLAASMSHVEMIAAENSRIVLSARARPLQPETPPPNG
jgi:hypothetical protein